MICGRNVIVYPVINNEKNSRYNAYEWRKRNKKLLQAFVFYIICCEVKFVYFIWKYHEIREEFGKIGNCRLQHR